MTSKPRSRKKQKVAPLEAVQPASTLPSKKDSIQLDLTQVQLMHLRDLFGILLNFNSQQTISEHIAMVAERELAERKLWLKISSLCEQVGIGLEDHAPDYVLTMNAPPQLCVTLIDEEAE